MLFFSPVPHGQIKDDAREEATFSHAKKKSCDKEASHVLGDTQQGGDCAPGEGEGGKP